MNFSWQLCFGGFEHVLPMLGLYQFLQVYQNGHIDFSLKKKTKFYRGLKIKIKEMVKWLIVHEVQPNSNGPLLQRK